MKILQKIYHRRFKEDIKLRTDIYRVLCEDFFSRYIPKDSIVLDVGAGYCEFINQIQAKTKMAIDLNPDLSKYANSDVLTINTNSTNILEVDNGSIDIVFVSNFFEHISKDDIQKTIQEIHRVLKNGGKLLILQPNFRFCFKEYWMFFDHITPVDDRSLIEVLEINNFEILENRPKFLPFTMKSKLPKSLWMLKLYLKIPLLQKIFGKQAFICAQSI